MKILLKLFFFVTLSCITMSIEASNTHHSNIDVETAIFAGGCFWCMQPVFENKPGILSSTAGYTGGHVENPTYQQVSHENTGHYESVEVKFDPDTISYHQLLELFWHNIDPVDAVGQFSDRGDSYRSAIFYSNDAQKKLAEQSKAEIELALKKKVETVIIPASKFYSAEEYHQDYHKKNPIRYKFYRYKCGRDRRLKEVWE